MKVQPNSSDAQNAITPSENTHKQPFTLYIPLTATLLKTNHEAKTSKVDENGRASVWEKPIAKKDNA